MFYFMQLAQSTGYNYLSKFTKDPSRGVDATTFAVEIGFEANEKWEDWRPFGDVEKRVLQGTRFWLVIRETIISSESACGFENGQTYKVGQIVEEKGVFHKMEYRGERAQHDICGYCGTDNGPNGEHRQGWDCCMCGGN